MTKVALQTHTDYRALEARPFQAGIETGSLMLLDDELQTTQESTRNASDAAHSHLREWRVYRNMSMSAVGRALRKQHTTIMRWERGDMRLSTEDLEKLATIYDATPRQLMAPPLAADLVTTLDRAQGIIETMSKTALEHWLSIGETLAERGGN